MEHAQPVVLTLARASYERVLGLLSVTASLADGGNKSSCFHLLPTFKLSLAEDDKDGILGPIGSHNYVWTGAVAMGMGGVMGFGCHFRGRPAASGYGFHVRKEILARCCRA